jgi:predicted GH43/DUF377 family glycosyl hydrolase
MINVIKHGEILKKTRFGFENGGVLNPGVIYDNGIAHILYRAVRKGNFSSIGYATLSSKNKVKERLPHPVIIPEHDYEKHGVEDPRVVKIDDVFFITYTAYDGTNANWALATSMDLKTFTKHGIITPQFNYKDFEFHIAC